MDISKENLHLQVTSKYIYIYTTVHLLHEVNFHGNFTCIIGNLPQRSKNTNFWEFYTIIGCSTVASDNQGKIP